MNKLALWKRHSSWDEAEKEWDRGARELKKNNPLKALKKLPDMPGITEETARHLKWKSLKYIIRHDHEGKIFQGFMKHPLKYGLRFLGSAISRSPFKREGDFFLYGIDNLQDFETLLKCDNTLLVLGFSYCHKPFECPSGRFTDDCIQDSEHPVCRQCFIGKTLNAVPDDGIIPLIIPTIHYIGEKIFDCVHRYPDKKIIFMITACEMTLKMFGDWGNMVGIEGVGVRLDGRICNTMKAFELSEKGVKPGLTVVLDQTQRLILRLIRMRSEAFSPQNKRGICEKACEGSVHNKDAP